MSHPAPVLTHAAPLPPWRDWQLLLDEAFPPKAWRIARTLEPIPVRARIVRREDGEEWLEAIATRWTSSSAPVESRDRRLGPLAIWVAVDDGRRR